MLWDTAGQEEFDAITKAYYRGAQACVLAFSTTDRMSFEAVKDWKMKVREMAFLFKWNIYKRVVQKETTCIRNSAVHKKNLIRSKQYYTGLFCKRKPRQAFAANL